jgi:hypothetical protein
VIEAEAHVGVRLQVKDPVAAGHRRFQHGDVQHIAFDQPHPVARQRVGEELAPPGAKVIDDRHLDLPCAEHVGEMTADEPGAPGDAHALHRALARADRMRARRTRLPIG